MDITAEPTPYDRVAYPTALFTQSNPERLAVLARLGGLDHVDPAQARILEVGGGDCMNSIAMASAWPGCTVHGFDLSQAAIARGQARLDRAGMGNVTLVVDDILRAHERYGPGSFDYVIVHGVYAWVPPHVREACMALIGHVLSEKGIAFVSYNCMPGGHVRQIMREMLLAEVGHIADPDEKIAATRAFLADYAVARDGDESMHTLLRQQAESMLERPDAVLFHDELGDCYYPQALRDVADAATAHGLKHLTDAGRNRHLDGFLEGVELDPDPDAQALRAAVRSDYVSMRFFRQTALIRAERQVERQLDPGRIADMLLTTRLERQNAEEFTLAGETIRITDPVLADGIERAAKASPQRSRIADFATTPEQLRAVLQLFNEWYVQLHLAPAPFVAVPGPYPRSSGLMRAMIAVGDTTLCTLNHSLLHIDQNELRALLLMADGTRTLAEVADGGHGIPPEQVEAALTAAAGMALMQA